MSGEDFAARIAATGKIFGLTVGTTAIDFDSTVKVNFLEEAPSNKRGFGLTRRDYGLFEASFSSRGSLLLCESIVVQFHRLAHYPEIVEEYGRIIGTVLPNAIFWSSVEKSLVNLMPPSGWMLQGHDNSFATYAFHASRVLAHVVLDDDHGRVEPGPHGVLWSLEILSDGLWSPALKAISRSALT